MKDLDSKSKRHKKIKPRTDDQQTSSLQRFNLESYSDQEEDRPLRKKHKLFIQPTLLQQEGHLELCTDQEGEGTLSQGTIDLGENWDTVTRLHKKKRKQKKIDFDASEVCSAELMSESSLKGDVGVLKSSSPKKRRRTESTATISDDLVFEQLESAERAGDFQSVFDEHGGDASQVSSMKSKKKNRSCRQSETVFAVISPENEMAANESEVILSNDVNILNGCKSPYRVKAELTTPTKPMKASRTSTGYDECVERPSTSNEITMNNISGSTASHRKKPQNLGDHPELRGSDVENSASYNVFFSAENSPESLDGSFRSDGKFEVRVTLSESMNAEYRTATDKTVRKKKKKRIASSGSVSQSEHEFGSSPSASKTKTMNYSMSGGMTNSREKQLGHGDHPQLCAYNDSDVENDVSNNVFFSVESSQEVLSGSLRSASNSKVNVNTEKLSKGMNAEHKTATDKTIRKKKRKRIASSGSVSQSEHEFDSSSSASKTKTMNYSMSGGLTNSREKQLDHGDHPQLCAYNDSDVESGVSNNVFFSVESSQEVSSGSLRSASNSKVNVNTEKLSESLNAEHRTATDKTIRKKKKKRIASSGSISQSEHEFGSSPSTSKTKTMNNDVSGSVTNGRENQIDRCDHPQLRAYSDSDVENSVSNNIFFSAESSQEVSSGNLRDASNSKVNVNNAKLSESMNAERGMAVDKTHKKTKRERIASSGSISLSERELGSSPSTSQTKVIICSVSGNTPSRPHKKKQRNIDSNNDVIVQNIFSSTGSPDKVVEGSSKNKESVKISHKRKHQTVAMIIDNAVSSQLVDGNEAVVEIDDDVTGSDTPSSSNGVRSKKKEESMKRPSVSQKAKLVLPSTTAHVEVDAVAGNYAEMESYAVYDLAELHKYNNVNYLKSKSDFINSGKCLVILCDIFIIY